MNESWAVITVTVVMLSLALAGVTYVFARHRESNLQHLSAWGECVERYAGKTDNRGVPLSITLCKYER